MTNIKTPSSINVIFNPKFQNNTLSSTEIYITTPDNTSNIKFSLDINNKIKNLSECLPQVSGEIYLDNHMSKIIIDTNLSFGQGFEDCWIEIVPYEPLMFAIKLSSSNALAINNTSPIFGCEYPFSVSSVSSGDTKELSASSRVTKELSINEDGATFKVTNLDTNPTFSVTHIKASSSQFYFNGTTSFNKKVLI